MHIETLRPSRGLPLVEAMRPKQWTKNAVLFAALVFGGKLLDPPLFARATAAFLVFCLLSGSIYLINDLVDLEKDRAHPTKRFRAIASGRLSPTTARLAMVPVWGLTLPAGLALGTPFLLTAAAYLLVMLAYQRFLKSYVLLDVFALATGFVLRAVAGAVVIDVPVSPWLYLVTILLALFLGFSKRRHELLLLNDRAGEHRPCLRQYSPALLDQLILLVGASAIMAYSLYTFTAPHLPRNHAMMATIPLVIYGLLRYLWLIHSADDGGGPPDELLLTDKPLLLTVVLWGLISALLLYG